MGEENHLILFSWRRGGEETSNVFFLLFPFHEIGFAVPSILSSPSISLSCKSLRKERRRRRKIVLGSDKKSKTIAKRKTMRENPLKRHDYGVCGERKDIHENMNWCNKRLQNMMMIYYYHLASVNRLSDSSGSNLSLSSSSPTRSSENTSEVTRRLHEKKEGEERERKKDPKDRHCFDLAPKENVFWVPLQQHSSLPIHCLIVLSPVHFFTLYCSLQPVVGN